MVEWVRERDLLVAAYAVGSYPDTAAVETYGGLGPFDGSTSGGCAREHRATSRPAST